MDSQGAMAHGFIGWVARENGTMSPLIAADELPWKYKLVGVPRNLPLDAGRIVAERKHPGLYIPEQSGPQMLQDPEQSSQGSCPSPAGTSPLLSYSCKPQPTNCAPNLQQTLQLTNLSSPSKSASLIAAIAAATGTDTTHRRARDSAHAQVPPSGVIPDHSKKEYCTYWIRTGSCDFIAQGCKYKHEMPDKAMLKTLGFNRTPRWWQEQNPVRLRRPESGDSEVAGRMSKLFDELRNDIPGADEDYDDPSHEPDHGHSAQRPLPTEQLSPKTRAATDNADSVSTSAFRNGVFVPSDKPVLTQASTPNPNLLPIRPRLPTAPSSPNSNPTSPTPAANLGKSSDDSARKSSALQSETLASVQGVKPSIAPSSSTAQCAPGMSASKFAGSPSRASSPSDSKHIVAPSNASGLSGSKYAVAPSNTPGLSGSKYAVAPSNTSGLSGSKYAVAPSSSSGLPTSKHAAAPTRASLPVAPLQAPKGPTRQPGLLARKHSDTKTRLGGGKSKERRQENEIRRLKAQLAEQQQAAKKSTLNPVGSSKATKQGADLISLL